MIAKFPKDLGTKISQKFDNFDKLLKAKTNNPEDVDALQQAMITMPMKINELRGEIDSVEVHICIMLWKSTYFIPHHYETNLI